MRYMSESKAILTSLTPDNIVWGGGVGTLGTEGLLFFFFFFESKYCRQYFRLVVEDKVLLVVFSSIVGIRLWFLTHINDS